MRLYFIRHGRQDSPLCNVDVPLDDAGWRQAKLVAQRLKLYDIGRLYSSNLIRARQTAEAISHELGLENHIEEDLQEISFGALTGLRDVEIKERYGDFLEERAKATSDIPYPEGESGRDVYDRVLPVVRKIMAEATEQNIENIAIVTHGGVIRTLVAGILGADLAKKLCIAKDLENCSITQIDYDTKYDKFIVERVNDYAHIEVEPMLMRKYFKRSL
ncbi:MAG: histidine phosphatase family protein [Lachnospiraceae bacterium]|nr:histidine phosphatase family protein [Lachnospiraceae bacterium]